jgi:hypothetical protein
MKPVQHVFQYVHQLALNILSLDFYFCILFILHPLAMKFVLVIKFGLYEERSHWHRKIEEFNMGAFMLNVSLTRTCWLLYGNDNTLSHLSDMRETDYSC